jgi:hypothetical protein
MEQGGEWWRAPEDSPEAEAAMNARDLRDAERALRRLQGRR